MTDLAISPVLLDRPKSAIPEAHPYFAPPVRGRNRHGKVWRTHCEVIGCPWKISARYKQDALVDGHDHRAEHIRSYRAEQAKAAVVMPTYEVARKASDLYGQYRRAEIALKADYNQDTYDAEMSAYLDLNIHLDGHALKGTVFDPWAVTLR